MLAILPAELQDDCGFPRKFIRLIQRTIRNDIAWFEAQPAARYRLRQYEPGEAYPFFPDPTRPVSVVVLPILGKYVRILVQPPSGRLSTSQLQ
jgi:hypothetical protein